MKFTIADAKVVELKVDGKSLGLFQIVGEWEGFKKLQLVNGSSCVILAPGNQEGYQFTGLFNSIFGVTEERDAVLIMASMDLQALFPGAKNDTN